MTHCLFCKERFHLWYHNVSAGNQRHVNKKKMYTEVLLNSMTLCKIIYHETKLLARHLKPTGYRLQV